MVSRQGVKVLKGNLYTVCFVDYGNTAITTLTDMVTSRNEVPVTDIIDECVPKEREAGVLLGSLTNNVSINFNINV